MTRAPIRVLIVDDSLLIRRILTDVLNADPEIEVVGVASDPLIARQQVKRLNPDVMTLDVEMPHMDGLAFLEKVMTLRPLPVVMVSTLTEAGTEISLRALEIGAVDVVAKPTGGDGATLEDIAEEVVAKVKVAARARLRGGRAKIPAPLARVGAHAGETCAVVAIGASTGGVEALRNVLIAMPADAPPIVIVQHMPARFVGGFAVRLNGLSAMTVAEAHHENELRPGTALIAPGDRHCEVVKFGGRLRIALRDGPPVSGHKPSVDVLFRSVARVAQSRAVGAILTGMGKDGAEGLKVMRESGAATLGQDEPTCVVYGMPNAAMRVGAVEEEAPLSRIAERILARATESRA